MTEEKAECEYPGYGSYTIREIRDILSGVEEYAAFTAYHLWKWYSENRFCGKCSGVLIHDEKERALKCPACAGSLNAMRNKKFPYCGNAYDIISDDWVLVDLKYA